MCIVSPPSLFAFRFHGLVLFCFCLFFLVFGCFLFSYFSVFVFVFFGKGGGKEYSSCELSE